MSMHSLLFFCEIINHTVRYDLSKTQNIVLATILPCLKLTSLANNNIMIKVFKKLQFRIAALEVMGRGRGRITSI